MRRADPIKDLFEQATLTADSEQRNHILGDAIKEIEGRSTPQALPKRPSRWSKIMKSKTTQFSTAAIVLMALCLFLINVMDPVAYGMPDVPSLYQSARTLHLKGTVFFPESDSSQSAPTEHWIDLENNRWRSLTPGSSQWRGKLTVLPAERLYDGTDIMMTVDHAEKKVAYYRLSRLQQTLEEHSQLQQWQMNVYGEPSNYDAYEIVDSETIDGAHYEVWEATVSQNRMFSFKRQTWVSPSTGRLLKSKTWLRLGEGPWQLKYDIDTIERDMEFAQDVFRMDPVSDYEVTSTLDDPESMPHGYVRIAPSDFSLTAYYLFALPDGSLIAIWSSEDKSTSDSQEGLFANLEPGSAFPVLPFQVHSLKAQLAEEAYVFKGCHLAWTLKEGRYYEFGLYVSRSGLPDDRLYSGAFLCEYQTIEENRTSSLMAIGVSAMIETDDDFNDLVLQAMAEFSDDQTRPALSLEEVLGLASQKRREL